MVTMTRPTQYDVSYNLLRARDFRAKGPGFLLASRIYIYREYPFRVLTTITTVGGVYVAYSGPKHASNTRPPYKFRKTREAARKGGGTEASVTQMASSEGTGARKKRDERHDTTPRAEARNGPDYLDLRQAVHD